MSQQCGRARVIPLLRTKDDGTGPKSCSLETEYQTHTEPKLLLASRPHVLPAHERKVSGSGHGFSPREHYHRKHIRYVSSWREAY